MVFILTPTTSVTGNIQVVARVLEVAIHKVHEIGFPLERIESGFGTAPLPPIGKILFLQWVALMTQLFMVVMCN